MLEGGLRQCRQPFGRATGQIQPSCNLFVTVAGPGAFQRGGHAFMMMMIELVSVSRCSRIAQQMGIQSSNTNRKHARNDQATHQFRNRNTVTRTHLTSIQIDREDHHHVKRKIVQDARLPRTSRLRNACTPRPSMANEALKGINDSDRSGGSTEVLAHPVAWFTSRLLPLHCAT